MSTPVHTVSITPAQALVAAGAPALFVFLWATGFIVARYGMPWAPPLGFLSMRFALNCAVLLPMIFLAGATWPSPREARHLALAGLLLHAGYLGGVWCAVKLGMPAGLSALIVNLQPIITALLGPLVLREHVGARRWAGLALGFAGVAMVVGERITLTGLDSRALWLCILALASISVGTIYQKKHIPSFDLRTGAFVQYAACFALVWPLSLALENEAFQWNAQLAGALAWSVVGLSIGAIFIMFRLIARGAATRVASLFYLVPPCTALMAWLLFGETFGVLALAGIAVTAAGVAVAQRG